MNRSEALQGEGFPEGVITAPVGTRYVDTVATNGAVEWVKASGTGNTGWVVTYGDTAVRDIAAEVEPGWTAAAFRVRRVGNNVEARFQITCQNALPLAWHTFYVPPTGFDHDTNHFDAESVVRTGGGSAVAYVAARGPAGDFLAPQRPDRCTTVGSRMSARARGRPSCPAPLNLGRNLGCQLSPP